ncbi:Uncharacterized protein TCM_021587 [Theobroma cacao]|uniref:Uncharacterized protein n=1 Tax=Theobroma cacao TaxID=3641 RepID=A0A061EQC4_THECC|nr:Uncharacterized protein TCM_021587 [Theobroma cacao]
MTYDTKAVFALPLIVHLGGTNLLKFESSEYGVLSCLFAPQTASLEPSIPRLRC